MKAAKMKRKKLLRKKQTPKNKRHSEQITMADMLSIKPSEKPEGFIFRLYQLDPLPFFALKAPHKHDRPEDPVKEHCDPYAYDAKAQPPS